MKSPLHYIGSKSIDFDKYKIKQSKIYCEPFGGGFNTGFNLAQQGYTGRIIYNDLDYQVFNFWVQLQINSLALLNEIDRLEKADFKQLILEDRHSKSEIEQAAIEYLHRKHIRIGGLAKKVNKSTFEPLDLIIASEYIKNIEFNSISVFNFIKENPALNNENTFILFDPPYIVNNVNNYYRCNSSQFSHKDLYSLIKDLKCRWLLTYNDNISIQCMYKEFNIEKISRNVCGKKYTELFITNF